MAEPVATSPRNSGMSVPLRVPVEAWVCDQPPLGARYRVVRDQWVEDYSVRLIHEIELVDAPVVDHDLVRMQTAALAEATADHYRARIAKDEAVKKAANPVKRG